MRLAMWAFRLGAIGYAVFYALHDAAPIGIRIWIEWD